MKCMSDIAVILPVYNAEPYLRSALNSILRQTYKEFRLCIIDDGSTDQSRKIIEDFSSQDSRIMFVSRENRGLVNTLNELAAMTPSKFLIRMDADDICEPNRFSELIAFMRANEDCVACGSEVLLIDPAGRPLRIMGEIESHEKIDAAHLSGVGGAIIHPASILRTSIFNEIGGYREEYAHAEDMDLFLRLGELGRLANLPSILLHYRQHFTSIGYSCRAQQRRSTYSAIQDAYRRRNINKDVAYEAEDVKLVTKRMVFLKWAWWALSYGYLVTARHYAVKALIRNIFSLDGWRLFACVFRDSLRAFSKPGKKMV